MTLKLNSPFKKQSQHYISSGVAFAYYRLPNSQKMERIAGKHQVTTTETASKGFLFHPFDTNDSQAAYLIEEDKKLSLKSTASLVSSFVKKEINTTKKKDFLHYIKLIKHEIEIGKSKKIVAARVKKVKRKKVFTPYLLFEKACLAYPSSFVSFVHLPEVGTWIGASPEVLVYEKKEMLFTYALAGTKLNDIATEWTNKEIAEQKIVSDFIDQQLKSNTKLKITKGKTETIVAGNLNHLRTVFSCAKTKLFDWRKVAKALHPTPAVAGLPQKAAINFIEKNETFNRAYYSGFLGPVNQNGETNLFVNLRCMEVTKKYLLFYAGCGITKDSDAKKEWKETKAKIQVLKSLL